MGRLAQRIYVDEGLDRLLVVTRTAILVALVALLTAATWAISEGEERGFITEGEDATYTMLAIVGVALLGMLVGRAVVSPLVRHQDARLTEALAQERAVRIELERELAARQAFIEQANHHLRTPVTVIYGMTQLLALRGDQFEPERRAEMRAVVLSNATALKGIVEDLSVFLDERVSERVASGPDS